MIRVGKRLLIASHPSPPMSPKDILVAIRPGSAFGDGSHSTTQMLLAILEREIRGGERVLDLGTGSGILAIAAAKLGARKVIAADIDRHACEVARENVHSNQLDGKVVIVHGSVEALHPHRRFDLIVANLYNAGQLKEVLPELIRRVEGHGKMLCSGIWRRRGDEILRLLTDAHFTVRSLQEEDAFVTIFAMKGA